MPLPEPGDPSLDGQLPLSALRWTIYMDVQSQVVAALVGRPALQQEEEAAANGPDPLPPPPAWAIEYREADRQGALVVARAQALGVLPGQAAAPARLPGGWPRARGRGGGVLAAGGIAEPA